ncbi:keratin associated protein [Mycolicibacterium canariasense]|uniref:Keratin associated protein n=1 Tax=Mycolicibacterium canariasense TaxID=228230 RepID=A0A100WJR3_MYCCR|nr:hypothetical protein [Mycolicibacterium canariasense]MCV7207268.1 hypothetical protein [Mycolicibacterium canariasense]ORV06506.1 hypothetical protein AWB94_16245 [Mycolicibacterium canariasense]GAS99475.1 keratin associated protein [Mycolicibacterium canariasense]
MRTIPSLVTAAVAAAAVAASIAGAAPAAAAPSGPPCEPLGAGATICQTAGHILVSATPTVKAPQAPQFNGWVGMVHHP